LRTIIVPIDCAVRSGPNGDEMSQAGRSLAGTLGGFIYGLLGTSALMLAASHAVAGEIGASFLLGGSLICVASALLLVSFRLYLRALGADDGPRAISAARTLARFGARLRGGASAELRLRRFSDHRFDGELIVRNPGRQPLTLARVTVRAPSGSRIASATAQGGDDDGGAPISINAETAATDLQGVLGPGESRCEALHLLLDDSGVCAPRVVVALDVVERGGSGAPHCLLVRAPIPR